MHLRTSPWKVVLAPDNRIREEGTPTRAVKDGTQEKKRGFDGEGKGVSGGGGGGWIDDGSDGPEGAD